MDCEVLKKRSEFKLASRYGKAVFSYSFVLQVVSSDKITSDHSSARYGITISKKVGCAVVRNRLKRILREIIKKSCYLMHSDLCYVIICKNKAYGKTQTELGKELVFCLHRANKIFSHRVMSTAIPRMTSQ